MQELPLLALLRALLPLLLLLLPLLLRALLLPLLLRALLLHGLLLLYLLLLPAGFHTGDSGTCMHYPVATILS